MTSPLMRPEHPAHRGDLGESTRFTVDWLLRTPLLVSKCEATRERQRRGLRRRIRAGPPSEWDGRYLGIDCIHTHNDSAPPTFKVCRFQIEVTKRNPTATYRGHTRRAGRRRELCARRSSSPTPER